MPRASVSFLSAIARDLELGGLEKGKEQGLAVIDASFAQACAALKELKDA